MHRFTRTLGRSIATAAVLVASAAPAFASGSGGGGGGGGGGTTSSSCGGLTAAVTASVSPAGYWQVTGKTATACDSNAGLDVVFADVSPADGCTLTIPTFHNASYFKYGVRPVSRYASGYIYGAASCVGTTRTITATLVDRFSGVVYGNSSTTWTV